ncbi:MAG: RIP metalloprotease RseP [Nitrospira sp.]|nr:RIP metalloprotease RseP [Nitrospira sp.]
MLSTFTWSPDTLWLLMQKAGWFLLMIGVLIAFHELGHFLAARWVGVKVLKFSLGFGPKLMGRQVGETEYLLSVVPLGGYVKLFGEDETEATTPEDRRRSFLHQGLWGKVLIVAAGPGFNFILAYLIFATWLAFGGGLPTSAIGSLMPDIQALRLDSPGYLAGLRVGDRVLKINQKEVTIRNEVFDIIEKSQGMPLVVEVRRKSEVLTFEVTPQAIVPNGTQQKDPHYTIGIEEAAPVIMQLTPKYPAAEAGIREGDRIEGINGEPIYTWIQMTKIIRDNPNKPLQLDINRNGQRLTIQITPSLEQETVDGNARAIGRIGAGPGQTLLHSSTPLLALTDGLKATWSWTEFTIVSLYKLITGDISRKNIGGPLMIANVSGEAAEKGLSSYIFLIALLSINLGVLNLLPIPILDGGHLFFFLIEGILRKPIGERQREVAQQVGLFLLVGVMIFAFWNDLERIFFR